MYYHLLHDPATSSKFVEQIRDCKELELLRFNPHFSVVYPISLLDTDLKKSVAASQDIQLKSFTLQQIVAPKELLKEYVAVDQPGLLHVSFTTVNYNIGFSIERVGAVKLVAGEWQESSNSAFERYSLCDSHLKPISRTLKVTQPGIYKVVWHNSYSYLKAKTVKYRIRVLTEPVARKPSKLDDLLTQGSLSETELELFRKMREVYPDYIPMVRIARPADKTV